MMTGTLTGSDIHRYDDIASNMGFPKKRSFEETNEDIVKEITRKLVYYVKSLQLSTIDELERTQTQHETGTGTDNQSFPTMTINQEGYPLLPVEACCVDLRKKPLETFT